MRLLGLLLGTALVGLAGAAKAETVGDPVGCGAQSGKPNIWEYGGRVAHNSYTLADQTAVTGVVTRSSCLSDSVRLRLEGAATYVDEDGRESQAIVFGGALPFFLWENASLTPSAHVGYENLHSGNDQFVTSAGITFEQQFVFADEDSNADNNTRLSFALRPEYSNREAVDASLVSGGDAVHVTGQARLSLSLGQNWRGRATATYVDVGGNSSIDRIGSIGFGIGQVERGWYNWALDLTYRKGDSNYEGVYMSLIFVNRDGI